MDLTTLKGLERTRKKPMKRKARGPGSGKGKTAGRGGKGHSARTGFANRYYFEGGQMPLVRRLPKHGFNNAIFRKINAVLNVSQLDVFNDGDSVGPAEFLAAGLINRELDGVKVLGDGELKKKLTIRAHAFSGSAKQKIQAAGGRYEFIKPELEQAKQKKEELARKRKDASLAKAKKKMDDAKKAEEPAPKAEKPKAEAKPQKPKADKPKPEKK